MHCLMFQGEKLSRMHLLHSVFTGFDTCKSLCKKTQPNLHIDFICVVLHCFPLLTVCQKSCYIKAWMLMHGVAFRKKGIFDEAMQTQANCIIQESKNMHL